MEGEEYRKFVLDDTVYETRLTRKYDRRQAWMPKNPRLIHAQIPGIIHSVAAKAGQKVRRGETLLVLEAMKMRNSITAPLDATIRAIVVQPGQMVTKGQLLIEFE